MPEGALPASVLEVEGLVTYRGPAQVLRGVALQVGPREAVCLVGRNGAGKTTTMESIMGLLPVRSGRVRFQGREITRLDPSERARLGLGYAPEDTGVFPELTVAENLALGLWLGAARRGRQGRDGEERESRIYELFPELGGEEDGGHRPGHGPRPRGPPAGRGLRGPGARGGQALRGRGRADQGDGDLAAHRRVQPGDGLACGRQAVYTR